MLSIHHLTSEFAVFIQIHVLKVFLCILGLTGNKMIFNLTKEQADTITESNFIH